MNAIIAAMLTMPNEITSEVDAIVGGYHGDAFRILGPHAVGGLDSDRWEVRAFLPQAHSAELLAAGKSYPMKKRHADGFFVAALDEQPVDYRISLKHWNGESVTIDDPYRFPLQLSGYDLHLHGEGTLFEAYRMLGAHLTESAGVSGVCFAVWAPNAEVVCVTGDFNHWDTRRHPMRVRDGVWELFVPGIGEGTHYKYFIRSRVHGYRQLKADPYGFGFETPPKSASVVRDLGQYDWGDGEWMEARARRNWLKEPMSVYEVHLESWMRKPGGDPMTYQELATALVDYVVHVGYTHVELLPPMEHPYSGSWGYQVVGYFAPSARFGDPDDFRYLIDKLHQAGIGVIVDWVPAHFPKDAHGLAYFDGTALYEHADPRKGEHRDWGTLIFNFGRNEVRSFLISNALFWLKEYHIDGLRVDAVASMLYLDYSRKEGEWVPNEYGGNENLDAISFLRKFNEEAHKISGAFTVAEESTAFPGVSKPVYLNGLGFTMKWNMGWMHDMLDYFSKDPIHRRYQQNNITFGLLYAFNENFVLPISHDEVVHGKRSLLDKMPGDEWRRFANARAFFAFMMGHPGKKLLFMGCDIGQHTEWDHNHQVQWELLTYEPHQKLQDLVRALHALYKSHPAMYEVDFHYTGFEWVDFRDADNSVIAFLRFSEGHRSALLFCCNFTPVPRQGYRLGVPFPGFYREVLNTDSAIFGGGNMGNSGGVSSEPVASHDRPQSIAATLPPLAVVVFEVPVTPR